MFLKIISVFLLATLPLCSVASTTNPKELVSIGLRAYQARQYEQAIVTLEEAYDKGAMQALVPLAYIRMFDLPGLPRDRIKSAKYMSKVRAVSGFNPMVYAAFFYQQTKVPESAYLVGLAYYLADNSDEYFIGDKKAWQFWFDKAVDEGLVDPLNYGKLSQMAEIL